MKKFFVPLFFATLATSFVSSAMQERGNVLWMVKRFIADIEAVVNGRKFNEKFNVDEFVNSHGKKFRHEFEKRKMLLGEKASEIEEMDPSKISKLDGPIEIKKPVGIRSSSIYLYHRETVYKNFPIYNIGPLKVIEGLDNTIKNQASLHNFVSTEDVEKIEFVSSLLEKARKLAEEREAKLLEQEPNFLENAYASYTVYLTKKVADLPKIARDGVREPVSVMSDLMRKIQEKVIKNVKKRKKVLAKKLGLEMAQGLKKEALGILQAWLALGIDEESFGEGKQQFEEGLAEGRKYNKFVAFKNRIEYRIFDPRRLSCNDNDMFPSTFAGYHEVLIRNSDLEFIADSMKKECSSQLVKEFKIFKGKLRDLKDNHMLIQVASNVECMKEKMEKSNNLKKTCELIDNILGIEPKVDGEVNEKEG